MRFNIALSERPFLKFDYNCSFCVEHASKGFQIFHIIKSIFDPLPVRFLHSRLFKQHDDIRIVIVGDSKAPIMVLCCGFLESDGICSIQMARAFAIRVRHSANRYNNLLYLIANSIFDKQRFCGFLPVSISGLQ